MRVKTPSSQSVRCSGLLVKEQTLDHQERKVAQRPHWQADQCLAEYTACECADTG